MAPTESMVEFLPVTLFCGQVSNRASGAQVCTCKRIEATTPRQPWSLCALLRRAFAKRDNRMALFSKRFPSRHTIVSAYYRDDLATINSNLVSWYKYEVFAASTP